MQPPFLQSRKKKLSLKKPIIMGILNVTDDSFSDGGKYLKPEKALQRALQMIKEGADIIDIGGESSGPDSKAISTQEELRRIIPVIEKLRKKSGIWISIDTYKADVAEKVLHTGADMINDVTALRGDPNMAKTLAKHNIPVVMMYSKDPTARTTRKATHYKNVLQTIENFLKKQLEYGIKNGLQRKNFILDPGMGMFISSEAKYSLQILKNLADFKKFNLPILLGASRKSFIGQTLDLPLKERTEAGLACAATGFLNGASIIRTHDVQSTRRCLDMLYAIQNA